MFDQVCALAMKVTGYANPTCVFSSEHISTSNNNIIIKPTFLKNIDIHRQFFQAKLTENMFCKNVKQFQ